MGFRRSFGRHECGPAWGRRIYPSSDGGRDIRVYLLAWSQGLRGPLFPGFDQRLRVSDKSQDTGDMPAGQGRIGLGANKGNMSKLYARNLFKLKCDQNGNGRRSPNFHRDVAGALLCITDKLLRVFQGASCFTIVFAEVEAICPMISKSRYE